MLQTRTSGKDSACADAFILALSVQAAVCGITERQNGIVAQTMPFCR